MGEGSVWCGGGDGEILVKGYKLPVIKLTILGNLMYSMVIIANIVTLYYVLESC